MLKIRSIIFLCVLLCSLHACKEDEANGITEIDELLKYSDGYGKRGDLEKSLIFANRAYVLEPGNEKVKMQLSKVYATIASSFVDKSDCNSANKYARKALEVYKDNDSANNEMASCAILEGKFEDCIKFSKEHLRLNKLYHSESGTPYHNMGVCYRELRQYDQSVRSFLEVLKRDKFRESSASLDELFSLGKLYFIIGNRKESRKYLEEFKQKYDNLSQWDLRQGFAVQYKESIRLLEVVNSGAKIGFPKGKEPAFNTDIVGVLGEKALGSKN